MYAAASGLLIGIPIALGSFAIAAALMWRLLDEEKFLAANLPGYIEYQKKVPHHLLPGVW